MNGKNFANKQRWYDQDPTLSLAVSFIRNSPVDLQNQVASRIIEKSLAMGIKVNEIQILLKRRWFDENESLSEAMEYLKQASDEEKKLLAIDIISFLTEIKS